MQDLAPKIKELQKKHGKDRQRLSQEQMALYSANRVNPMSGCLPILLQIPIFLGLYQGITNLSRSHEGVWDGGFLWLTSLADADPIKILPILAAVFQFVQTRMMRPYKQGKITDPQQAMMNTMMNFMPLTVILFGWTFASGAVLYWATQSVYSVVQQWIITGWGSMRDWFPRLPELPEHRRLGYRPPRDPADVVVMSGEGAPVRAGAMGWLQKRMEEAQRQAEARRDGAAGSTQARADAEAETVVTGSTAAAKSGPAQPLTRATARRGGRGTAGQRAKAAGGQARNGGGQGARADGASRAVVVPRKARPATSADGKTGS
jgi:YidC/Oxa1 family membrane protein insertase